MKSPDIKALTADIQTILDSGPTGESPEVLAASYARECRQVNERLSRITEMLDAGGELQALQYAEAPPRLLDRAADLSFGEEPAWQDYCKAHSHEVAPLINLDPLDRIEKAYGQGLSSGHPVYKDYRAAVLSRDDAKAYDLARLIVRMNPGDGNAQSELARLERKKVQGLLKELRSAHEAKRDDELMSILAAFEDVASPEDLENEPDYQKAAERRSSLRRGEALREIPDLLNRVEEILASSDSDWRQGAVAFAEVEAKLREFNIDLADADSGRFRMAEEQLEEHRREAERLANVAKTTRELSALAEDVNARSVTPQGLDRDYSEEALGKILKFERELTALRGELPSSEHARLKATRGQLDQIIERHRSRRRARLIGSSVAAIIILTLASIFGILAMQAGERRSLLSEYRQEGQSTAAAQLVTALQESDGFLLKFPGLAAELAATEQWLTTVNGISSRVNQEMGKLEAMAGTGFAKIEPPDLFDRLTDAADLCSKLPEDVAGESDARLTILRNEADRYFLARQEAAARASKALAADIEAKLDALDFSGPAASAREYAQSWKNQLDPFLAMANRPAPVLRLPSAEAGRIEDAGARVQKQLTLAEDSLEALERVRSGSSLPEYSLALKNLAATGFREASMAQRIVDALPDERRLRAFLLFRDNLEALSAAENMPGVDLPTPAAASQLDRDTIDGLQSDPFLSGIWDVEWTSGGKTYRALSRGELEKVDDGWIGSIAILPRFRGVKPEFKDRALRGVIRNKPSAVADMMQSLQLGNVLDPTGTEFQTSVVALLDRVFNHPDAHPLAKAYVANKLFRLLRGRETEWGIHFIPALGDDMNESWKLEIKSPPTSYDWLQQKPAEWAQAWVSYFEQRPARDYYDNLRITRDIVWICSGQPIKLAGFVGVDGQAQLLPSGAPQLVWGLCSTAQNLPELQMLGELAKGAVTLTLPESALPLSPLFAVELARDSYREFLLNMHQQTSTQDN